MSFAEIILRIGASIGGWLIFIAHALILSVIRQADCSPLSTELWRGTLFFALLSALALCFVGRGLPWREAIRWFALPAVALALYAVFQILPAMAGSVLGGESLCVVLTAKGSAAQASAAGARIPAIERVWAPIQLGVLAAGVWQGVRYWWQPRQGPLAR